MRFNKALQPAGGHRGRPVLAKGLRARRGGMGIVPAAELDRQTALDTVAPIEAVILLVAAASVALAVVASVRVVRERSEFGRSVAQLAFVWLIPIIGPLVTIQLLRREPEKHRLAETDPPNEVDGKIDNRSASYRPRRDERTEESEPD